MEQHHHDLSSLFEQLGMDSTPEAIQAFVRAHRPLAPEVKLAHASFWSDSQAAFLREKVKEDADWAVVVDTLDAMLRLPDVAVNA